MQTNSMNKSQSLIKTKTSKGEFKKKKEKKEGDC
jgi:GTP cyclohydrolase I